jgi:hypothetical protein
LSNHCEVSEASSSQFVGRRHSHIIVTKGAQVNAFCCPYSGPNK